MSAMRRSEVGLLPQASVSGPSLASFGREKVAASIHESSGLTIAFSV
jgi:hypothetical protein